MPSEENTFRPSDKAQELPFRLNAEYFPEEGITSHLPPAIFSPEEPILTAEAPKKPHPGFWWSILWSFVFLMVTNGLVIVAMIVGMVGMMLVSPQAREALDKVSKAEGDEAKKLVTTELGSVLGPSMLFGEVGSVIFALVIIRLIVGKDWMRCLGLRAPSSTHLLLTILMFPAMMFLAGMVHMWAKDVTDSFHLPKLADDNELLQIFDQWPLWFGVLIIGMGPGIGEELMCRGFLGRGLVGRYGWVGGILLTSLFFGVMHLDPAKIAGTAALGACMHYVYATTRSLWLPMLLHFLNNSAALVLSRLPAAQAIDPESAQGTEEWIIPGLSFAAILLFASVCWALYRSRAQLVTTGEEGKLPWHPSFPGVEHPPEDRATIVVPGQPGLMASLAVAITFVPFFLVIAIVVYFTSGQ